MAQCFEDQPRPSATGSLIISQTANLHKSIITVNNVRDQENKGIGLRKDHERERI